MRDSKEVLGTGPGRNPSTQSPRAPRAEIPVTYQCDPLPHLMQETRTPPWEAQPPHQDRDATTEGARWRPSSQHFRPRCHIPSTGGCPNSTSHSCQCSGCRAWPPNLAGHPMKPRSPKSPWRRGSRVTREEQNPGACLSQTPRTHKLLRTVGSPCEGNNPSPPGWRAAASRG